MINRIKQAILTAITDAGNYPRASAVYKGKPTECIRHSVYGVSSAPPGGSLGILFEVDGSNGTRYGIFDYVTGRFKNLTPGEVQIGNYLTQASIKFDKDGNVLVNVPSGNLTANVSGNTDITTDTLSINASNGSTINGTLNVNGVVTATDFISSSISVSFNSHFHTGDSGGSTSTPQ